MIRSAKQIALVFTMLTEAACTAQSGGAKRGAQGATDKQEEVTDDGDDGDKKDTCLAGFNVVNGAETTAYPSVALLAELDPENVIGGTCSGTWIGSNTMLTAAHCITDGAETEIVYLEGSSRTTGKTLQEAQQIADGGVKPKKVVINAQELMHGNLKDGQIQMNLAYKDMAILIFDDDVAPATTKILDREPKDQEKATLIGFGVTESDVTTAKAGEKSIKRVGKNHVVVREELKTAFPDLLVLFGPGNTTDSSGKATNSLSGAGDSGGPIMIDGAVAGVVSNGTGDEGSDHQIADLATEFNGSKGDHITVYASLNSDFAKDLLNEAKAQGAKFSFGAGAGATEETTSGKSKSSCLTEGTVP